METKFNFKSAICTSREQSERLLALGLKPETADMVWLNHALTEDYDDWRSEPIYKDWEEWQKDGIPAWSLHRLIEMMPQIIGHLELAVNDAFVGYYEDRCESETGMYWEHTDESSNLYDNIISTIEWLIKEGYFNKVLEFPTEEMRDAFYDNL